MAAEDAGTIAAQIRLELNQMEKDGLQAQKMMDSYAQKFKAQGEKGGKMYVTGFGSAQLALNTKLNSMVSSLQGISPKMGMLGDKIAKSFSKPIFSMVPAVSSAFMAMLGVIGPIIAVVTALAAVIKKLVDRHKENTKAMELSKTTSAQLNNVTDELTAAQNASADALVKMGIGYMNAKEKIQQAEKAEEEYYDKLDEYYDSLYDVTKTQDDYAEQIEQLAALEEKMTKATDEANKARKEEKKAIKEAKESIKELNGEIGKSRSDFFNQMANIANAEKNAGKSAAEASRERISAMGKYRDSLVQALTAAQSMAAHNEDARQKVIELQAAIAELTDEINKSAEAERRQQLRNIDERLRLKIIDETEALKEQLGIKEEEVALLYEAYEIELRRANTESEALALQYQHHQVTAVQTKNNLDIAIQQREEMKARLRLLEESNNAETDAEKIEKARLAALDKFRQAEQKAHDARMAGLINEQEEEKQIQAALAQKYSDLEAIVTQYKLIDGETVRLRDQTAELVRQNQIKEEQVAIDALLVAQSDTLTQQQIETLTVVAASARTERQRNAALEEANELEIELINLQRQRAREALEQSKEYLAASDEERERILDNFDRITEGMIAAKQELKKNGNLLEALFNNADQLANAGIDTIGKFAELSATLIQKSVDKQLKALDKYYNGKGGLFELLEKEKQERLYAAGFIEAVTEEQYQKELELAKESGDQKRLFEAHSNYERFKIEQEYADKKEELEKEMNRKTAELEYQAALAQWKNQLLMSIASGAQATINAFKTQPVAVGIAMGSLMTGLTAAQIAIVQANKPVMQTFSEGGIVTGNSFTGDRILAGLNSEEMVINKKQQKNLWNVAQNGAESTGTRTLTLIVNLNSRPITKAVVEDINNRHELIFEGSIVR